MSDMTAVLRLTAEATSALQGIQAVQAGIKQTGADARATSTATKEVGVSLVEAGAKGKTAIDGASVSMGRLRQSMQDVAASDPGEQIRASFDALRASVDPAFASAQRYRDIQVSLAEMVATGEVRQSAANIVLEQAGSRYLGVATAAERLTAAQEAETAASATAVAGLQQLIAQFDPLYTSSMRYEQAITQITAALEAEAISEAQANRLRANASQQLLGVSNASMKAANAAEKVGFAANLAAGGGLRGIGMQLSQVAQQGSVTGNYLGALAVQLPDIGLAFGGVGIAVGALAAVLGPVLLSALGNAKSAEDRVTEATDTLGSSISALKSITAEFANGDLTTLKAKYGEVDAALLQLIGHQREEQIIGAQNAAKEAIKALADEYGVASGQLNLYRITGQGAANDVAKALGLSKYAMLAFEQALKDAQNAKTFDQQAEALARVDELLKRSTINGGKLGNSVTDAALKLHEVAKAAKDSQAAFDKATSIFAPLQRMIDASLVAMQTLVVTEPDETWLDTGISKARELLKTLRESASVQNVRWMQSVDTMSWPQAGKHRDGVEAGASDSYVYMGVLSPDTPRPKARPVELDMGDGSIPSGGGGGQRSDTLASLQTEAKAAMTSLDNAIGAINEKVHAGLMSTSEAAGAVTSAKETAAGAIADLLPKLDQMGPAGKTAADTWRGALKGLADQLKDVGTGVDGLSTTMTDNFRAPFAAFLSGTKSAGAAWDDFVSGINNAIATKLSNKFTDSILGPILDGLFSGFSGFKLFADGGLPGLPSMSGSVLSTPTAFAIPGGGVGVMAEAGTEAVMPVKSGPGGYSVTGLMGGHEVLLGLGRGQDGKLGVTLPAPRAFASGGIPGANLNLEAANTNGGAGAGTAGARAAGRAGNTYITVNNTAPQTTTRVDERMQGDDHIITLMVEAVSDAIAENINAGRGSLPGTMQAVYGLARQGR
ncbi:MAG: phage tail tape measure protein [Cypionkella sp.]